MFFCNWISPLTQNAKWHFAPKCCWNRPLKEKKENVEKEPFFKFPSKLSWYGFVVFFVYLVDLIKCKLYQDYINYINRLTIKSKKNLLGCKYGRLGDMILRKIFRQQGSSCQCNVSQGRKLGGPTFYMWKFLRPTKQNLKHIKKNVLLVHVNVI